MLTRDDIINKALELGFADIGFTTAEPFDTQKELLCQRQEEYGWIGKMGLDLVAGTDPKIILPGRPIHHSAHRGLLQGGLPFATGAPFRAMLPG